MSTTASAYPWREEAVRAIDETAPSGPDSHIATRSSSRRSEKQMAEEYTALKEAGMPLDSMKLVLNEDLSAVRGSALEK